LKKKLWNEYIEQIKISTSYPPEPPALPGYISPIFFITGFFDILGSSLAAIGLVWIDASVWMMFRGSMIIFAGFLSCLFLKKKMGVKHWLGIGITALGLVLVGLASILKKNTKGSTDPKAISQSQTLLGIMFIVVGQLLSASQMVLQELFMRSRQNIHPMQVVGTEGMFGFLAMSLVFLPAFYFIPCPGEHRCEDALDAFYQIYNSPKLLAFCLCYICSIAFYNFLGIAVTKSLSAVHRCIIDGCRTLAVWIVNLFIYYVIERSLDSSADPTFGEKFDTTYGFLQIDGFLFLLIGSALYNEIMDIPCLPPYEEPIEDQPDDLASTTSTAKVRQKLSVNVGVAVTLTTNGDVHQSEPTERTRLLSSNIKT